MAFVDELTIHCRAGNGGNGIVSWLHLKGKEFSGPAGGEGGKGGDVIVKAVGDFQALSVFPQRQSFAAENGGHGKSRTKHGADGEDLILEVPAGSVVINLKTGFEYELVQIGDSTRILKGGVGGHGNAYFKGSRNVSPTESTKGTKGDEADIKIELRLIAHAGFIGFPNAGKSSLLNALTGAHSKIGSYQFTTLTPHLGVLGAFILADIPGLIEGASMNRGLGHAFLRHITRTKVLLHCISLESEDVLHDYRIIKQELAAYDQQLLKKPEILILTKKDLVTEEKVAQIKQSLKDINPDMIAVSIEDSESLEALKQKIIKTVS